MNWAPELVLLRSMQFITVGYDHTVNKEIIKSKALRSTIQSKELIECELGHVHIQPRLAVSWKYFCGGVYCKNTCEMRHLQYNIVKSN
jgi:hypothetical protein